MFTGCFGGVSRVFALGGTGNPASSATATDAVTEANLLFFLPPFDLDFLFVDTFGVADFDDKSS